MAHLRFRKRTTKGGYLFPDQEFQASCAVRAGNLVFLQGQTGMTLDGQDFVGKGDPALQAENAMKCVKVLLEEAGARIEDICKIVTYVTDVSYRELVYPVIFKHLIDVYPVSTGLVVSALARPELDFEIDVYAVVSHALD
jgi:enamine deaminase RidA (YjgF/YER057c/UK114 family)